MKIRLALRAVLALSLSLTTLAACGGSSNNPADAKMITNPPDANVDATVPPADANCIETPTTSDELMNACTTADKVDKHPTLPLQQSDGGLPALP